MNSIAFDRQENNVDFSPAHIEGIFDTPVILPEKYIEAKYIPFNIASTAKNPENLGVHFFIDDFLFQRLWGYKNKYLKMLQQFKTVISPNYSMYTDYPIMVQMFNHYRNHLLGAWMQSNGIKVFPSIMWSDESSYSWCFNGDPHNSTIVVSSVGTQKEKEPKRLFLKGYEKMLEVLEPERILFYGTIPKECQGNIVPIEAYYKTVRERVNNNDKN